MEMRGRRERVRGGVEKGGEREWSLLIGEAEKNPAIVSVEVLYVSLQEHGNIGM